MQFAATAGGARLIALFLQRPYLTIVLVAVSVGTVAALWNKEVACLYWRYLKRFLTEWKETWKKELSTTVILAVIIFIIQYQRREADAAKALDDVLIAVAIMLIGWAAFHVIRVPSLLQHERHDDKIADSSNLRADFDGFLVGKVYLADDGIWSTSSMPTIREYTAFRMRVTNNPITGQTVGSARAVSVQVEFIHDTGLHAASGAPTAWLNEKRSRVDLDLGDQKEVIIAVGSGKDWFTVTNVRDDTGHPTDWRAMELRPAPWFKTRQKN